MNIFLKPFIFCIAIASTNLISIHSAQALAHTNAGDRVDVSSISFDPDDAGSCKGEKCAAGGSY